jgi:hypothetical protein
VVIIIGVMDMFEKFAEDVYRRYIEKMAVLDNSDTQGTTIPPLKSREVDQSIPSESVEQLTAQPVTQSKNNSKPIGVTGKAQQTVGNVYNQMGNFYFNKAQEGEKIRNAIINMLGQENPYADNFINSKYY